jgi:hypothetical protein
MTICDYACEECGHEYRGCGGLGVLESGSARQTVSSPDCTAVHDVETGANLRTRGGTSIDDVLAALAFACPVDPSHAVRPWTDGEAGWTVPGALVSLCPVCEGHVRAVRMVMLMD